MTAPPPAPTGTRRDSTLLDGTPLDGNLLDGTLLDGTLLDGRVRHLQAARGRRTGIEPVLLAAAIPARPGERVLEAGAGSAAALLCLAARVPGLRGMGVERDPAAAAIARANLAANGHAGITIETAAIEASDAVGARCFEHAMANPPWHEARATPSPDAARDAAHRADDGLLARWAAAMARALVRRGTLTFVVAASVMPGCIAALAQAGIGDVALFPLWPRAGAAAKLVLIQGRREGRGPGRVLAGLALHEADGAYTPAAAAVLRDGAALDFSA